MKTYVLTEEQRVANNYVLGESVEVNNTRYYIVERGTLPPKQYSYEIEGNFDSLSDGQKNVINRFLCGEHIGPIYSKYGIVYDNGVSVNIWTYTVTTLRYYLEYKEVLEHESNKLDLDTLMRQYDNIIKQKEDAFNDNLSKCRTVSDFIKLCHTNRLMLKAEELYDNFGMSLNDEINIEQNRVYTGEESFYYNYTIDELTLFRIPISNGNVIVVTLDDDKRSHQNTEIEGKLEFLIFFYKNMRGVKVCEKEVNDRLEAISGLSTKDKYDKVREFIREELIEEQKILMEKRIKYGY
jgi:hypothetical protein